MPSIRVSKDMNSSLYFVTCTIKDWLYILDRYDRWGLLTNSLEYCQQNKDLQIFAYVFMINHIHMIIQCPDVAGFVRDFKKYTAYELMQNIRSTEPSLESAFMKNGKYCIWEKTNMPKVIESEDYFWQKKEYIENNPVKRTYVARPEYWLHSSACPHGPLAIADPFEYQDQVAQGTPAPA